MNDERLCTSKTHDRRVLGAARRVARSRIWQRRAPLSIVAVVVLAIAILPLTRNWNSADVLRSATTGIEQTVTPAGGTELQEPPRSFSWPAQAGVASYRLVLRNAAAEVIWRGQDSAEPQEDLDDSVRRALTPQTYYWTVELEGIGSTRVLGPFWFRLLPP